MRSSPAMVAILGIDAAWTKTKPSGVALVVGEPRSWRCVAAAPSMAAFVAVDATGADASFDKIAATQVTVRALLEHARALAPEHDVTVVAVDMPLSTEPIEGRRDADKKVSKDFGARGCSTHSPTKERPGPIAEAMRRDFKREGFTLTVDSDHDRAVPALIEVYPHPALLALLDRPKRVKYKLARASRYWRDVVPPLTPAQRRDRIGNEWSAIVVGLTSELGPLPLPPLDTVARAAWKGYEDALDAIICAWVGTRFVEGADRVKAYGDATAAIWCPV